MLAPNQRFSQISRIVSSFGHILTAHLNYILANFGTYIDYPQRQAFLTNIINRYQTKYQEFSRHNILINIENSLDLDLLNYNYTNQLQEYKTYKQHFDQAKKQKPNMAFDPLFPLQVLVLYPSKQGIAQNPQSYITKSLPYRLNQARHDLIYRNATIATFIAQLKRLKPSYSIKDINLKLDSFFSKNKLSDGLGKIEFEPDFLLNDFVFGEIDMANHTIDCPNSKIIKKIKELKRYYYASRKLLPYIFLTTNQERIKKIIEVYKQSDCPYRDDKQTNDFLFFATYNHINNYFKRGLGGLNHIESSKNIFTDQVFFTLNLNKGRLALTKEN